ncbi:MAG: hypothetical protein ACTHN3_13675 [Solirubrobacterales bacterium]
MATVKHLITENDVVELARTVGKWPAGTLGAAVSDHGPSKLVEVSDRRGVMLDLLEVAEEDLRLVSKHPMRNE